MDNQESGKQQAKSNNNNNSSNNNNMDNNNNNNNNNNHQQQRGSVKLARITKIKAKLPTTAEFVSVNVLSWQPNNILTVITNTKEKLTIPVWQLSPYDLKDADGNLFENIWQASKIYKKVYNQDQWKSYGPNNTNVCIWKHPSEVHMQADEYGKHQILPTYWEWRNKLTAAPYPVRYPNGFQGRHECVCVLWKNEEGEYEKLDYITSRKKVYLKLYCDLVKKLPAFQQLKQLLDSGHNLQICEIDVPDSIDVTESNFQQYLHDTSRAFGHGWALSAALLGTEHWLNDNSSEEEEHF